jgi:hypothetical protein
MASSTLSTPLKADLIMCLEEIQAEEENKGAAMPGQKVHYVHSDI